MAGRFIVAVAVVLVAAIGKAMIDNGTLISLLGGVACSSSQGSDCGTYRELADDLDRVEREAGAAQDQLTERFDRLETERFGGLESELNQLAGDVDRLKSEPALPDDWADFTSYTWKRDDGEPRPSPVQMIPADEGFCFLTRIEGSFEGDREWAEIVSSSGRWVLNGGPGNALAAHARCWSFPRPTTTP